MSNESRLRARAIANGPEAFSLRRIRAAAALTHTEAIAGSPYTLYVRGGLGSFSVGTLAAIRQGEKYIASTYDIPSWVYEGKEEALEGARAWAADELKRRGIGTGKAAE